jgi:hypothetical protein
MSFVFSSWLHACTSSVSTAPGERHGLFVLQVVAIGTLSAVTSTVFPCDMLELREWMACGTQKSSKCSITFFQLWVSAISRVPEWYSTQKTANHRRGYCGIKVQPNFREEAEKRTRAALWPNGIGIRWTLIDQRRKFCWFFVRSNCPLGRLFFRCSKSKSEN